MQITTLFSNEEERAVSPVIGVILMVAITVILAAVIGTFVLGLGDQVQTTAPNAQFSFDYDSAANDNLTVTHNGGDGIEASELYLSGDVETAGGAGDLSWAETGSVSSTVRAGQSVRVGDESSDSTVDYDWGTSDNTGSGAEVSVVWQDADSDQSSTLRTWSEG